MLLSSVTAFVPLGRLHYERSQRHEDIGLLHNLGTYFGHLIASKKRFLIGAVAHFHINNIILATDGFRWGDRLRGKRLERAKKAG